MVTHLNIAARYCISSSVRFLNPLPLISKPTPTGLLTIGGYTLIVTFIFIFIFIVVVTIITLFLRELHSVVRTIVRINLYTHRNIVVVC